MPPLRNSRRIHPRMVEHYAPAVAGGMVSTVRLRRPDHVGVRDPVTGRTTFTAAAAYYEGPGRVQTRGDATPADQADRQITVGDHLVAVPVDAGIPQDGDLVDVLACPAEPLLVGVTLLVRQVGRADITLQRNLGCDLQKPAT